MNNKRTAQLSNKNFWKGNVVKTKFEYANGYTKKTKN